MSDKNIMVTFGTGGHSTEMLMLFEDCNLDSQHIDKLTLVLSEGDHLIENKLKSLLKYDESNYKIDKVILRRARRVGQSYVTSIWTTLLTLLQSLILIKDHKPRLLLTNGPAVSVVLSISIRLLEVLSLGFRKRCKILYVESFCRTKSLSLSGKLIYHLRLANQFYVQWHSLAKMYPNAKYIGLLV